jgi:hypothetical protein
VSLVGRNGSPRQAGVRLVPKRLDLKTAVLAKRGFRPAPRWLTPAVAPLFFTCRTRYAEIR